MVLGGEAERLLVSQHAKADLLAVGVVFVLRYDRARRIGRREVHDLPDVAVGVVDVDVFQGVAYGLPLFRCQQAADAASV